MAYQELSDKELDISMAEGFLREWLKNDPAQVLDNFKVLVDGVTHYRERYLSAQEDNDKLLANYNRLTGQAAMFLQNIEQLKQQNDQLLIDSQRDLHHGEE